MIHIVVKARFSYLAMDGRERWPVKKGDFGIIRPESHRRYARFVEPTVIWDADPSRKARRPILSSLAVVGLQARGVRLMVSQSTRVHP